ncbi:olfactory receptor 13D1-like [Discoglossus pictus]
MQSRNQSIVIEFILLGLSSDPDIQVLLFPMFLIIYIITLSGNVLLIVAVTLDHHLHSPMYIFLTNLSLMDICYTSIIVPKMLMDLNSLKKSISFNGCIAQTFLYLFLGESECLILAFMSYDRFVAICNPLRYNMIMNKMTCARIIIASWMSGCIISLIDMFFTYSLTFCGPNIIDHFFCEVPLLLEMSCSDIAVNNIVKLVGSTILLLIPLFLILLSYIKIISAITRINSGRNKAFSTCVSHLIVVVLFYGTAIFMYMTPRNLAGATDKIVSVFYTIITPMLNPLIYSLRNKDVHRALRFVGRSAVINHHS